MCGEANDVYALFPTPSGYALWLTRLEAQNCLREEECGMKSKLYKMQTMLSIP